jgi:hypothetical protein
MPDAPRRKFTLADVMIVVAAAAVGALLLRAHREERDARRLVYSQSYVVDYGAEASPFLLVVAPTILALRAIPPRPRARRLFRQPGTVACLVTVFDRLILLVRVSRDYALHHRPFPVQLFIITALRSGLLVAEAWAVLALARAWRPEASWVDRAGRAYGVLMIGIWALLFFGL